MTDKTIKTEGPACACGRGDLYEEWLKSNEAGENKEASLSANKGDSGFASDSAEKKNNKLKKIDPKA